MSKLYKLKNYKFILVIYVLILNTLGVFLVGSASPGDQKKQIIGMVSGIVIMVILSLIDYSFILRFSWIIYLLAVGLLALVLVAGDSSKGAQRWFEIGGIRFQPSELVKILLILFFAYYFMKYEEKINTLVFCALLFMAGLNYKLVVGVLIVCIPVGLIGMTLIIQDKIPFIHAYQLGRIMAWLYPDDYPDLAYQQQNSIMAIGSGLLWGKGLNNTDPTSVKNGTSK